MTGFFFSPEGGFIEDSCPSLTTEYFFRYILVSNCGCDACQSVQHLHFHVLGGKKMAEAMA